MNQIRSKSVKTETSKDFIKLTGLDNIDLFIEI